MNVNDLPPAAKLAALIEAGRAANPDLKHGRGSLLREGAACAMGFAALAAGAARELLGSRSHDAKCSEVERVLGEMLGFGKIAIAVWEMNDNGASLEEICASLREGELSKVPA